MGGNRYRFAQFSKWEFGGGGKGARFDEIEYVGFFSRFCSFSLFPFCKRMNFLWCNLYVIFREKFVGTVMYSIVTPINNDHTIFDNIALDIDSHFIYQSNIEQSSSTLLANNHRCTSTHFNKSASPNTWSNQLIAPSTMTRRQCFSSQTTLTLLQMMTGALRK